MMQLEPSQMDLMATLSLDSYVRKQLTRLRETYKEDFQEDTHEDMDVFVRTGIKLAESYGLEDQGNVSDFLDFIVTYGEDFAEDAEMAWALTILQNEEWDEFQKMEELDEAETFMALEEDGS